MKHIHPWRRLAIAAAVIALCLLSLRLIPHPPLRDRAPCSRAFYTSDGVLLRLTLASDSQYRVWTPLARIDPRLVDAVQLYANLAKVQVCAASGDLPNEECKDLATTWFIPGKSPIKVSTLHRAVWVDDANGRAVCAGSVHAHREVFEYWGSDMLQVFTQAGMPRRVPPAVVHCGATANDDGPQIVSPLRGASYVLRLMHSPTLTLRANAGRQGPLYWFADSAYLGTMSPGKDLVWQPPAAGRYALSAVDAQGVADTREVSVEFAP
jgi:penicillin-binding protein 1C